MTRVPQTVQVASEPQTLIELLQQRCAQQPDQRTYTFLIDGASTETHLTYSELDRQARAIGTTLYHMGAEGERVLLLYPSGLEYIAAFFGCLYAGATAVPGYPPRFHRSLERLQTIAEDAHAAVVLTTAALLTKTKQWFTRAPDLTRLRWLATDQPALETDNTWTPPKIQGDHLALLQYTSGSTNIPKGVMLNHTNLLYNTEQTQRVLEHTKQSIGVGWLPLHHDMGLIGSVLQPLAAGFPCILMPPMVFLQRPVRWLQAISHYRATTSGGPNFAYDLCVRKITPEQRATLDLSSWDAAINGAETIRSSTLDQFIDAFAPSGFRREAFYPCYGLAEVTLMASGGSKHSTPVVHTVQKVAMEQHQLALPCIGTIGSQTLVGCGKSLGDQKIRIVDPDTLTTCGPNNIGEVWVAGNSVSQGYWNQPQATQETFGAYLADSGEGPFLRTGDLGFLHHGELFITSRLKDVIVIRSKTYHPQDIEYTVEQSHPALRSHCCAAFAVEFQGAESLIVVQEIERCRRAKPHALGVGHKESGEILRHLDIDLIMGNICQAVIEKHDVPVSAIVLIQAGSLPKTSSGKIRRHACRTQFLNQHLDIVGQWHTTLVPAEHRGAVTLQGAEHAHRQFPAANVALRQSDEHVA